jgi:hypothetical protein
MLTNPLCYSAIIALCALAREIVRCRYRHRDLTFLLEKTQDPSSLRYLAQLEEARHARPPVSNKLLFTPRDTGNVRNRRNVTNTGVD